METKSDVNSVTNKIMYKCDSFSILHSNIQSVNGRLSSLSSIVKTLDIDLVTLNETNLKGKNKLHLEGFRVFCRNRKGGNMGGVSTSIKEKYAPSTLKVSEGASEEYIITRHGQFIPAINVINLYGSQESRKTAEEIKEGWEIILEEILKIEAKNESLILLGDLNRHISNSIVKNNHLKISLGGRLLNEFISQGNYTLVNSLE